MIPDKLIINQTHSNMKATVMFLIFFSFQWISCNTNQNKTSDNPITPDSAHNSRNSVDWKGIYRGVLPCEDCQGTQTEIKLNSDLTFEISRKYLGKSNEIFQEGGTFIWDDMGSKVSLKMGKEPAEQNQFLVGENQLIKLDEKGNRISGENGERYILKKADFDKEITEKYWKLIELNGKKISAPTDQNKEAHFILKAEDSRLVGNGGCNTFGGSYELAEGNKIMFSNIVSTKMACPDVKYESDFLGVFEQSDNYSIKEGILTFNKAKMAALAKFEVVYFY